MLSVRIDSSKTRGHCSSFARRLGAPGECASRKAIRSTILVELSLTICSPIDVHGSRRNSDKEVRKTQLSTLILSQVADDTSHVPGPTALNHRFHETADVNIPKPDSSYNYSQGKMRLSSAVKQYRCSVLNALTDFVMHSIVGTPCARKVVPSGNSNIDALMISLASASFRRHVVIVSHISLTVTVALSRFLLLAAFQIMITQMRKMRSGAVRRKIQLLMRYTTCINLEETDGMNDQSYWPKWTMVLHFERSISQC